MLQTDNTICIFIDVQDKLLSVMHEKEKLVQNLQVFLKGMNILSIPIIWFEQNPERLGRTVPELKQILEKGNEPISKLSFSCCAAAGTMARLEESGRKEVLIVGIETHVCVYQTARELMEQGYSVNVIEDCVTSRTPGNRQTALNRIRDIGGGVLSYEMVLFELLKKAEGPEFKEILRIVK